MSPGKECGLSCRAASLARLALGRVRPGRRRPASPARNRHIWSNLRQIASSPTKLALLLGGSFAQELVVAMALPGGMGVVEAGMILGLTAAGVPEADATAAVFIQRLFGSYLPPIWGWITLIWMRKKEYL